MNEHMTFIAVQPVQAKAETSTRASATGSPRSEAELRDAIGPRIVLSERAEATTRAWTGWWR